MKSKNMISATGRYPASANPTAAPTIACSLIGVARTRSVPYLVDSPLVTLKTPPIGSATSSPSTMTLSSRAMALSSAEPIATADVIVDDCGSADCSNAVISSHPIHGAGEDVGVEVVDVPQLAGAGEVERVCDFVRAGLLCGLQVCARGQLVVH